MSYISGDSSLSDNVASDLDEMKQVGSDDSLNILALVDRSGPADTKLLRIETSNTEEIPLSHMNSSWSNELNLGNPQTLVDFVKWSVEAYPAEHYVLDLWGHGRGWEGVCPDKGDYLTTQEMTVAMIAISDMGILLDLITIDACQMGMLETVYELRHASIYAIVSEKDVPLNGWPYQDVLSILSNDPGTSIVDFGKGMIDAYLKWGLVHSRYSITLSFINLSNINSVVHALDDYCVGASKMVDYFNQEFVRARSDTEEYDGDNEYDLWHLLDNINNITKCKKLEILSNLLFSGLSSCIVYERHWTNELDEPADNSHGLSIWFPKHLPPTRYLDLGLSKDTGWDEFLTEMSPYFSSPERIDIAVENNAEALDVDADGLDDLLEFSSFVPFDVTGGLFELEVFGPNASLAYYYESESNGWHNLSFPPEVLGSYFASFYLWNVQGELVNYSFEDSGLNKEGWSTITGYVTSNVGRGLKWTQISLYESDGRLIRSTTTDLTGQYDLRIKVPTETDGLNLTLSCGLGAQRQNLTLEQLLSDHNYDFTVENTHISVLWFTYSTIIMNLLAILCLGAWLFFNKKRSKENQLESENKTF
jgi:hypothetical protein